MYYVMAPYITGCVMNTSAYTEIGQPGIIIILVAISYSPPIHPSIEADMITSDLLVPTVSVTY